MAQPPKPPRPSKESISQNLDLSISLSLSLWPALSLAVSNQWGGPNSSEKRDWFAGAVSDLFATSPHQEIDEEYLEEFLLQVMNDEFEVNVEDGSGEEVAQRILGLRGECLQGWFGGVERVFAEWEEREGRRKVRGGVEGFVRGEDGDGEGEGDEDEDGEGSEEDSEDGDEEEDVEMGDVEMGDAPPLENKKGKEKLVPEIDEEGFTKVVGRRKR